jgi:hypothetical protein
MGEFVARVIIEASAASVLPTNHATLPAAVVVVVVDAGIKALILRKGYRNNQRQSTLDCLYPTLLCENLKKRMLLRNGSQFDSHGAYM